MTPASNVTKLVASATEHARYLRADPTGYPRAAELLEQLVAAVEALLETNKVLNRRCQSAESGLAVRLEEEGRKGRSFGRILANAAATMYREQREVAQRDAAIAKDAVQILEQQLKDSHMCGDPNYECPLQDAHKPYGHYAVITPYRERHPIDVTPERDAGEPVR